MSILFLLRESREKKIDERDLFFLSIIDSIYESSRKTDFGSPKPRMDCGSFLPTK